MKSSVFLCCITKKYTESNNCVREILIVDQISKQLEILIFEKLEIGKIGGVGLIIALYISSQFFWGITCTKYSEINGKRPSFMQFWTL